MQFTSLDKSRISYYYQKNLQKYGNYNPQALGWTGETEQLIRFQALLDIGDLTGRTILDVGSGLGDLYYFLRLNLDHFAYLGVELVPVLYAEAQKKYPEAKFINQDFLEFPVHLFDYVLSSGAMSFKVPNHKEKYFAMIEKMFALSKAGVAFNMLNKAWHADDDLYAAYDSAEIEAFCRTIAPKIILKTDYSPQDFTVYLYK